MTWFGTILAVGMVIGTLVVIRRRQNRPSHHRTAHTGRWWSTFTAAFSGDKRDIADVVAEKCAALAHPTLGALGAPEVVYIRTSVAEATILRRQPIKAEKVILANLNRRLKSKCERAGLEFAPCMSITLQVEIGPREVVVSFVALDDPFGVRAAASASTDAPVYDDDTLWPPFRGRAGDNKHDSAETGSIPVEDPIDGHDIPTPPLNDLPTRPMQGRRTIELELHVPGSSSTELVAPASPDLPVSVGRSAGCALRLPEMPGLSNRHVSLHWTPNGVAARDTSTWGTYLRMDAGTWQRLPKDTLTLLPADALLALDPEGFVTLAVTVSTSAKATQ
ncbi:hypothetical protein B7R54_17425 [Subtercola boreus]|uniref:FHA domain-containing protein n=1 Tax=Subtercola boreus TaxID=120213 RepID=A0A3E0VPK9_9MICO|nr:FHA domain-containing protein [Subtercola boreus]RFA10787.1 hypothetical protein B7R54_17425 [Subtercola boreus]TQL55639.1 FHA domain-containing protein [Subtercola boreus]